MRTAVEKIMRVVRDSLSVLGLLAALSLLPLFLMGRGVILLVYPAWMWFFLGGAIALLATIAWWHHIGSRASKLPWYRAITIPLALGTLTPVWGAQALRVACSYLSYEPYEETAYLEKAYMLGSDSICRFQVVLSSERLGREKFCASRIEYDNLEGVSIVLLTGRQSSLGTVLEKITAIE